MADLDKPQLVRLNPDFEQFMKSQHDNGPTTEDIPGMRAWLLEGKKAFNDKYSREITGVTITDQSVKARDGHDIPIRIYRPEAESPEGPLVVYHHGGGFVFGGLDNETLVCKRIAQTYNAVVINTDYRLAPEYPFPTAVHDSWDVLEWAAKNGRQLGADPGVGFIVGGNSAGGNLAAVLSVKAKERDLQTPLTGTLLVIPATLGWPDVPERYRKAATSYEENKGAPLMDITLLRWFTDTYKGDTSSDWNVLHNEVEDFAGLPPTYLQVCGLDPLRDDGIIYERVLREKGVKTKLQLYPGVPHGFWSFAPDLAISKKFVDETVEGIGWLLTQRGSAE